MLMHDTANAKRRNPALPADATHCHAGLHELTPDNVGHVAPTGGRYCRACHGLAVRRGPQPRKVVEGGTCRRGHGPLQAEHLQPAGDDGHGGTHYTCRICAREDGRRKYQEKVGRPADPARGGRPRHPDPVFA